MGRALVNCASDKYICSPIKLESADSKLVKLGSVRLTPLRVCRVIPPAEHFNDLTRPSGFSSYLGHGKHGSGVALWQVPS